MLTSSRQLGLHHQGGPGILRRLQAGGVGPVDQGGPVGGRPVRRLLQRAAAAERARGGRPTGWIPAPSGQVRLLNPPHGQNPPLCSSPLARCCLRYPREHAHGLVHRRISRSQQFIAVTFDTPARGAQRVVNWYSERHSYGRSGPWMTSMPHCGLLTASMGCSAQRRQCRDGRHVAKRTLLQDHARVVLYRHQSASTDHWRQSAGTDGRPSRARLEKPFSE